MHFLSHDGTAPRLVVQTSLSPLRVLDVAPYNQFTVTCTARAEFNGETIPLEITIEWRRKFVPLSSSDPIYMTTGSPESGYQSILSTTEMNAMNIIYSCLARLAVDSLIIGQDNIHLQVHGVYSCTYLMKQYFIHNTLIFIILQDQDSLWSQWQSQQQMFRTAVPSSSGQCPP